MLSTLFIATAASALLGQEPGKDAPIIQPLQLVPAPPSEPWDERAKHAFFRFADRDEDGFLVAEEVDRMIARRIGAPRPGPAFVNVRDEDRDGRLSLHEVLASTM